MAVTSAGGSAAAEPAFPRYFRIAGRWINSYRVFLFVGFYCGILVSAAVAQESGISPLRMGVGSLLCAIVGLVGARVYHLAVSYRRYPKERFWAEARNTNRGGLGVLGGLVMVPFSFLFAASIHIPAAVFWDHLIVGIVVGGVWIRFGCVCNGCCCGRVTTGVLGVRQHDVTGVSERRVPVQWLEIGWWLLACGGLVWLWPKSLPAGTYALAGLAWYGAGRFWQEPLRARQEIVLGRVRLDQLVAALLTVVAGSGLLLRVWGG